MPEYTYKCTECEHEFVVIKKMTSEGPEVCMKCEGPVNRVWTADFTFMVDKSTDSYVAGKPGDYEAGVAEGAY